MRRLRYVINISKYFALILLCSTIVLAQNVSNIEDANTLYKPEIVQQYDNLITRSQVQAFLKILDSCQFAGLDKEKYHYNDIKNIALSPENLSPKQKALFLENLITYFKDLYRGYNIKNIISYDGISPKYFNRDDSFLTDKLLQVKQKEDLLQLTLSLEPQTCQYNLLKQELRKQLQERDFQKISQLWQALNIERWINHFKFNNYILVNIASASLRYYQNDSVWLEMKIVAGKPATKTPRFAAYCNEVIFYPYWHVPRSIVVNEILPLCKKNLSILTTMNLQVIDTKGNVVNPGRLDWYSYSPSYFPYTLRQSTGCDNALGLIKFNLTSPYSVYMHDTNFKNAFSSKSRYFSHGCIRIEKPAQLASLLLPTKIDATFLKACLKNQKPLTQPLAQQVPIFIIYCTANLENENNTIKYYKDVYRLII